MKHVVAFDVSKSTLVIYDHRKRCIFEGELKHSLADFKTLHERMVSLEQQSGQKPEIVFEATGVYSMALEKFLQDHGYVYCRLNPLEAKLQTAAMRRNKTDKSDAHELAKTHFKINRNLTFQQDTYYNQMRALSRYHEVLVHSKTVIRNRLKSNTKKNLSLRLADLRDKKEEIIAKMVALFVDKKEYHILCSFPGIGDSTACRIIGELGDLQRFKNAKQLNAYVGIDIMRYQSGNTQYRDRINKRGNKKLRKILYFMIFSMISLRKKGNNHIVDYYDKLKKTSEKTS